MWITGLREKKDLFYLERKGTEKRRRELRTKIELGDARESREKKYLFVVVFVRLYIPILCVEYARKKLFLSLQEIS